jgi:hypothetical protein
MRSKEDIFAIPKDVPTISEIEFEQRVKNGQNL